MELNTYAAFDNLPNIFEGIGILPAQYSDMRRKSLPSQGERKLLFAVLEDAIRCYLKRRDAGPDSRNEEFLEAVEWLSSDDQSSPFTFVSVCEGLGIDADGLRAGICKHTGRFVEIRN